MSEELSHVGMFNCFVCGDPAGVVLDRRLRQVLPRNVGCLDKVPCPKCQAFMKQGIILLSVGPDKTDDKSNPYRTGVWCVPKEEAYVRIFGTPPKSRAAFVPDALWDAIGLPRQAAEEKAHD